VTRRRRSKELAYGRIMCFTNKAQVKNVGKYSDKVGSKRGKNKINVKR
jgi:hypothetical protein